jgi:hypothetical protein
MPGDQQQHDGAQWLRIAQVVAVFFRLNQFADRIRFGMLATIRANRGACS